MKKTLAESQTPYYVVISTVTKHEPAAGHGYPAYSYEELQYTEIGTKEALEKWLVKNNSTNYPVRDYKVVLCTPVQVKVKVNVTIEPKIYV